MGETVVDRLPAQGRQKVPSLQLSVDMSVHDVFLLLLCQLGEKRIILNELARLHVDTGVDRAKLTVLMLSEFFVPLVE